MKSNGKDVEAKQTNQYTGAHHASNWWMMPVVAMLALPTHAWSQFTEPERVGFSSGRSWEWGASFSSDMLEVYWVGSNGAPAWDVFSARRASIDAPWEDSEPVDAVNTNRAESAPHLSHDGLTLTFASFGREGGYGGLDLWQTTRASRGDPWQEPVNMGPTINTRRNEGGATFSKDGLEIIFNDGCPGGPCSPTKLRRSIRENLDDEWTTPEEMTPSDRGDQLGAVAHPTLSPDGLSLYFSQTGSFGDWDIFVSERPSLDAPFGEQENLGAPVNSKARDGSARVAPDGALYYGPWSGGPLRIWRAEAETPSNLIFLNAGDADQDLDFDQLDLVQVQLAAKYLTGETATWGEGDWNGAPGGAPGNPPAGDGLFNQFDIVAAQQGAAYLAGPYAAVQPNGKSGDSQTSLVYNPGSGELSVDAPAGMELTSINIDSVAGIFTGQAAENLGGSFDNDADGNVFKATFGSSFGSLSFGNVAQVGLSEEFVLDDLSVVGSLAGGGDLGNVDLVYVPEPASVLLLFVGLAIGLVHFRRVNR